MATIDDLLSECDCLSAEAPKGQFKALPRDPKTTLPARVRFDGLNANGQPAHVIAAVCDSLLLDNAGTAAWLAFAANNIGTLATALRAALPVVEAANKWGAVSTARNAHREICDACKVGSYCPHAVRFREQFAEAVKAIESAARAAKKSDRE